LERTAALVDLRHGISLVYYSKGVVMLSSKAGFFRSGGAAWAANEDVEVMAGLRLSSAQPPRNSHLSIVRAYCQGCLQTRFQPPNSHSWGRIRELGDIPHPEASLRPNPRHPPEADCPSAYPRWVARAKRSLPVIRGHHQIPGRDKSLAPSGNKPTFFLDGR
jgi:hypothetical protein